MIPTSLFIKCTGEEEAQPMVVGWDLAGQGQKGRGQGEIQGAE